MFAAHAIDAVLLSPGDVDGDSTLTISDLTRLIDYLFRGGPAPIPILRGDLNGDCGVNVADVTLLIAVLFRGVPLPTEMCEEVA
ncbi:MAG: dockerin type I repeat-containing protein [candidate division Zixibacteria bacterium]|nr:dockerin type I repeat-containing protein [candidate division Zixibacteria bacterium]